MYEEYHYKGFFNFYFHPTNQTKIAKKYLRDIFPPESIRQSKRIAKTLNDFDTKKFLNDNANLLLYPLKFYKTDLLKEYLERINKEQPELVAIFYLLLDDVLKSIIFPSEFNIENELAQNIIITTLNRNI